MPSPFAALAFASVAAAQTAAAPIEVIFPVRDSLTVVADVHRGPAGASGPTILLFHQGGGSARGEYRAITPRLVRQGYNVIAADIRGGGDRFGAPNRLGSQPAGTFRYCEALAEVDAAVNFARVRGFTGPLVLWGSSYSATLALQVAARRSADVHAVLAFSPASGEPMKGCQPAPYVGWLARAGVPTLVLRPRVELEDSSRAAAFEAMRRDGAEVFVAEQGVHGSSMLDSERTKASTEPQWNAVCAFLRRALEPRKAPPAVRVVYLANEGVMLESAAGRVYIDALFRDGLPEYSVVPGPNRDSLERALAGYGGPAVVLTTHAHRDHFDSAAVGRYLGSNPDAVALGPPGPSQRGDLVSLDLDWVKVRPVAVPHEPTRRPIGHTGYLVTLGGTTVLHVGDTTSEPGTWPALGLPSEGVDIALVPYWYALDAELFSELLTVVGRARVILLHAPLPAAESEDLKGRGGWSALSRSLRERHAQVRTPSAPGEAVEVSADR